MSTNTTINGFQIPQLGDIPNIETAIHPFANAIDARVNPIFLTISARNTAIPSPEEGQMAYCKDSKEFYIYSGTSWISARPRFKMKTSLTSRTSSTLTDDPDLQISLEASSTYIINAMYRQTSGLNTEFNFQNAYTGTMSAGWSDVIIHHGAATDSSGDILSELPWNSMHTAGGLTTTFPEMVKISVTTSTAGTLKLQWAPNANGFSATLEAFSSWEVWKIA